MYELVARTTTVATTFIRSHVISLFPLGLDKIVDFWDTTKMQNWFMLQDFSIATIKNIPYALIRRTRESWSCRMLRSTK